MPTGLEEHHKTWEKGNREKFVIPKSHLSGRLLRRRQRITDRITKTASTRNKRAAHRDEKSKAW